MDNGTTFIGNEVKEFCYKYHIERKLSTTYYTQGNDQAKAYNNVIKSILSKTTVKHGKDWHEKLPYDLWACRTSIRTSVGVTPFFFNVW